MGKGSPKSASPDFANDMPQMTVAVVFRSDKLLKLDAYTAENCESVLYELEA
jgi:hypothetical protein